MGYGVDVGNRGRDAAIGAGVAMLAATLFIEATFVIHERSLKHALSLLLPAAGYALLVSWLVVPLGAIVGLQMNRIAGDGRFAGIMLRSAIASASIAIAGALLLRIPVDAHRLMTGTGPFHDLPTWWADFRGTLLYFGVVGLYSFPWIAFLAWRRSRISASPRRAG